jgi:urease accessory protein
MINLFSKTDCSDVIDEFLILPFDIRQKSRFRAKTESGKDVGVMIERGGVLRGGDVLLSDDGEVKVQIIAAAQSVMTVKAKNQKQLMRAAYHLGNRHVPLQVDQDWLRLEEDYVLKNMLIAMGVEVINEKAPFEPESGAYVGGHHHETLSISPRKTNK